MLATISELFGPNYPTYEAVGTDDIVGIKGHAVAEVVAEAPKGVARAFL